MATANVWIYEEVMKKLYGFIPRLQLLCNGVRDTSEFLASFQIGFANQTNYTGRRKKDVLFGVYNKCVGFEFAPTCNLAR